MLKAVYQKYALHFKTPSGTSRGILTDKETYFIKIWDEVSPEIFGIGECALFRGLSAEESPEYEKVLAETCRNINDLDINTLQEWSSIRFGVETALSDLKHEGKRICFPSDFTQGERAIEINGLIWMGDWQTMLKRIEEKLKMGFGCIKIKIGAIDFEEELSLLSYIRQNFSRREVELRVDANGAFSVKDAPFRLDALARFDLHSIEQPIRQGEWKEMAYLCSVTPIPIALDEELIGVNYHEFKKALLSEIKPHYIILKPSLVGGFQGSEEWIELAKEKNIGWWVTSALESNIGLNAIAQWTATLNNSMPQGLGTGKLYNNNIPSPLEQSGKYLKYIPERVWDFQSLQWE